MGLLVVSRDKERAEPGGNALNVPVDLHSNSHRWSSGLASDLTKGLIFRDKMKPSDFQRELEVEPLNHFDRNELKWVGHLIRTPPGHIPV